jgi:hypothetical protein
MYRHIIFNKKENDVIISTYLKTQGKKSEECFLTSGDICKGNLWIPCHVANQSDIMLPSREEYKLIVLTTDRTLEIIFRQTLFHVFWLSIGNEYSEFSKKAHKIFILFTSMYLREAGFLAVNSLIPEEY